MENTPPKTAFAKCWTVRHGDEDILSQLTCFITGGKKRKEKKNQQRPRKLCRDSILAFYGLKSSADGKESIFEEPSSTSLHAKL